MASFDKLVCWFSSSQTVDQRWPKVKDGQEVTHRMVNFDNDFVPVFVIITAEGNDGTPQKPTRIPLSRETQKV
jgi:hypothetical protein